MTTPSDEKPYLLDTDDEELVRLGIQHRLWGQQAHRAWERCRIGPGSRVLDVGCGPGYATMDLAQLVGGTGRVMGIDASPRFVAHARAVADRLGLAHADVRTGDVEDLPGAVGDSAPFDAAWSRWVPSFLTRPARMVEGLAKLVRAGGRLAIQDYFDYQSITLAPRLDSFEPVKAAIRESWAQSGGDTDVMGRMPAMLVGAGFRIVHLEAHQRVARPGESMWQWPTTFFASYVPRLVEMGLLREDQAEAFMADWREMTSRHAHDPSTSHVFFNAPPVYEVVAEREANE